MKILIAEDESIIRLDLSETLANLDFEIVASVANGKDAITQTHLLKPEVILLDVKMPVMDGLTAAESLIKDGFCCILLTAFSSPEVVNRATEIGVDGYIIKPWRTESLRPAIEIGYGQFQRRSRLEKTIANKERDLMEHKIIDRARAIIISKYHLTEAEAFKVMQRAAMDGRKPMIDVAQSIVESN